MQDKKNMWEIFESIILLDSGNFNNSYICSRKCQMTKGYEKITGVPL